MEYILNTYKNLGSSQMHFAKWKYLILKII